MVGTGSCHDHSGRLDCGLLRLADSWFLQFRKIQSLEFNKVVDHLSVQVIDHGEVCNIFICQKRLGGLEELNNHIIETQIQDPILMIQAWLHHAFVDDLGDGRIVDGFDTWPTFLTVVTLSLIPCCWQDTLYLEMMAFLLMGLDNFDLDEFKNAAFKELT
jgi:hypothetical protein